MNNSQAYNKRYFLSNIFFGLVLLFIGTNSLVYGINDRINFIEKSNHYESVDATVIDYDYGKDNKAAEIIEYSVNGNIYVKTLDKYTNNPLNINDTLTIKYNPSNPYDMIYSKNYSIYIVIMFGFIILSISIIIVVKNYLHLRR